MDKSNISIKKWGIISIVVLLVLEFIFFPWLGWLDSNKGELERLKALVGKQERLLDSETSIDEKFEQLSTQLVVFGDIPVLSKEQDAALLWLQAVDTAVSRFDVDVNNKAPTREIEINDIYSVFAGQLSVSGSYNNVLSLLYELENISTGSRVRQVSLSQDKARPGKVTANIEFLRVFKKL